MLLRWRAVDAPTPTRLWQEWYETHIEACWLSSMRHEQEGKIWSHSLLDKDFGQKHVKIRAWNALGPLLNGFGQFPDSWAVLQ